MEPMTGAIKPNRSRAVMLAFLVFVLVAAAGTAVFLVPETRTISAHKVDKPHSQITVAPADSPLVRDTSSALSVKPAPDAGTRVTAGKIPPPAAATVTTATLPPAAAPQAAAGGNAATQREQCAAAVQALGLCDARPRR